jgi:hypothetical protein
MVPTTYHSFFMATTSVSGALIGLLFVAISVAPHKLSGEQASLAFQLRAGMAFSALIDALILSLVALLPNPDLGFWGMVIAIFALSSVLGMAFVGVRRTRGEKRQVILAIRLAMMFAVFAVQLAWSIDWLGSPKGTGSLNVDTIVVITLFLIAIDRAWELLGGTNTGLLSLLYRARRRQGEEGAGEQNSTED